jgi:hypothetical protein
MRLMSYLNKTKNKSNKKSWVGFLLQLALVLGFFCTYTPANAGFSASVNAVLDGTVNNQQAVAASVATEEDNGLILLHSSQDRSTQTAEKKHGVKKQLSKAKREKSTVNE